LTPKDDIFASLYIFLLLWEKSDLPPPPLSPPPCPVTSKRKLTLRLGKPYNRKVLRECVEKGAGGRRRGDSKKLSNSWL
jgi:hypothetical protein